MRTLNTIYVITLVLLACAYGLGFAWWVFFCSLLIALIPFATSKFWFGLPIGILIWSFWITDSPLYGDMFAWLILIYAPFHYVGFTVMIIDGIKNILDI